MLRTKKCRLLAIILAAAIAVLALAAGLSGTLAAKPDIVENFSQQNTYPVVEKGSTVDRSTVGGRKINTSDPLIATATMVNGVVTVTGVSAGVVAVMPSSSNGNVARWMYQVTDSGNITGYKIKNGGEVQFSVPKAGQTLTKPAPVTTVPANAPITWKSLQPGVASVHPASGVIKAESRGMAIIVGEFTDKWGVKHDLHILVGVGVSLGGNGDLNHPDLSDLLEWIQKGEGIIALNPNPYKPPGIDALQDAVDGGYGVLNKQNPTENDIKNAVQDIKDAINALEPNGPATPPGILGPDKNGNYYKPVGEPPNVYEVVNQDGSSKTQPPTYVYNPDGDPVNQSAKNEPAEKGSNGGYYVEKKPRPSNIWNKVKGDGTLDSNAVWGGPDGKPGTSDDQNLTEFSGEYWVSMGQNVWRKVTPGSPLNPVGSIGPLTGGGITENPAVFPATPVYEHTDGKYYLGPLGPDSDGNMYYFGDKQAGGDGKLNSNSHPYILQHPTDDKFYLCGGNMTTTKPGGTAAVTSVTVSPNPVSIAKGGVQQFTATVNGTGSPAQMVSWTVTGGGAGTSIDASTGVLQVASNETATSLTVKATSTHDKSKSGTAIATVSSTVEKEYVWDANDMEFFSIGYKTNPPYGSWTYQQFGAFDKTWTFESPKSTNPLNPPKPTNLVAGDWWGFRFNFNDIEFTPGDTVDLMFYVISNGNLKMTGSIYLNEDYSHPFKTGVTFADQGKGPDGRKDHYPLVVTGIPLSKGKVTLQFQIDDISPADNVGTITYGFKTVGKVHVKA